MNDIRKRYRAVILTALPVEYKAVRGHLSPESIKESVHEKGTVYEIGEFSGSKADWQISLVEVGAGNAGAAFEAERAIATFRPVVALFVGIAGGVKDVAIGDIVFATKVYGYEAGKDRANFEPRPSVGESTYPLEQRARAEARKLDWLNRLPAQSLNIAPKVFVGPLAADEKVIASTRSKTFTFLRKNYGDGLAVEMEGRGFLGVLRANRHVEAGVIRGISDLIDEKSAVELKGTQEMASLHAAAFAFQLLDQFDVQGELLGDADVSTQIRYVVVISGEFSQENISFAKAAFAFLKERAKDSSMVLEEVKPGSIAMHVRGTLAGFERLIVEFKSGQLLEIGNCNVVDLVFGSIVADVGNERSKIGPQQVQYRVAELEAEDVKLLFSRMLIIARLLVGRSRTDLTPEDLVSEAIARYLSGNRVRPPEVPLRDFLAVVMRSIVSSSRRDWEKLVDFSEADFVVDTLADPESQYSEAELLSSARERLERYPLELAIFNSIVEGRVSTREIAQELGISPESVDKSRRTLRVILGKMLQ